MSDRSGGSAAIGGFLYQLIMHLDWIANLAVTDVGVGHKLVLEPRGGGDAHIHHANRRIIEQYKTRQNEGTWSIRDIVRGPFVDFVRAARTKKLQNDKFRFVTDGRISHQVGLLAFLERIAQSTRDGLAPDDQMVWSYTRFGKYTDRALLGWIRSEIEVELKDKSSLDDDTLAHVLSRVELLGGVDAAATEESLDDLLRRCLPDPSKACDVRLELVGRMLAQLATGEVSVHADAFLRESGIDIRCASYLADRCTRLAGFLRKIIVRGTRQYHPDRDIRQPPHWDLSDKPILALTGRPGVGKTWQLARLALDLADRGLPCVFQPIQTDALQSLDAAAHTYWNDILGRPTIINISALKQAIRQATRNAQGDADRSPWLVVLLDGPLAVSDLLTLIDKVALDEELRIVVTIPPDVGERMSREYGQAVQVLPISEFTSSELSVYLDAFGIDWEEIPADLSALLRLPLLANLFVRSGHTSFTEAPDSEYALFEKLWESAGSKARTGTSTLRAIARYASKHPNEQSFAIEHALENSDRTVLDNLVSAGWIEIDAHDRVQFAHDRLLNWALADAIVTDVAAGVIANADLPSAVGFPSVHGSRFGYLLMDVLWKLTSSAEQGLASATSLLLQVEKNSYDIRATEFYQHLLPTIGENALALLRARLHARDQAEHQYYDVMRAVRVIGRQFAERPSTPLLVDCAREWLGTARQAETDFGLALVEEAGIAELADSILSIHLADARRLHVDVSTHLDYEASFGALKACVKRRSEWLNGHLGSTEDPEMLSVLSWQLLNLEHPSAPSIWEAHRGRFVRFSSDSARGVLACIRRFRDISLIEYVTNAVATTNRHEAGDAFCVLAVLDPKGALAELDKIEKFELYAWRNEWVQELHNALPDETEAWLERTLGESLQYELFPVISRRASEKLVKSVLQRFAALAAERMNTDNPWTTGWVKIFTEIRGRNEITTLVGSETERQLVSIAKRRVNPAREFHDHLLEDIRSILMAIGGPGIQELIKFELENTRGRSAHRALELVPLIPWPDAEYLLMSHVAKIEQSKESESDWVSNHDAIVALAALGAQEELQEAVRTSVIRGCPTDALDLRRGQVAFAATRIAEIEQGLEEAATLSEDQLVRTLMLAALAQDSSLAPAIEQALLARALSESEFIHGVYAALEYLPVPESLALSSQGWLVNEKTRMHAINLHLASRSDKCLSQLLRYAESIATTNPHLAAQIVAHFPSGSEIGAAADSLATQLFNAAEYADDCYERVARCGTRTERDILRHRAYYADPNFLNVRRSAIDALATFDPLGAARAALWLVEKVPHQEAFAVDIVMEFGADDDCIQLFTLCDEVERPSLWSHVGRALRRRGKNSREKLMREVHASDQIVFRRAFAELGGWLGESYRAELQARYQSEPTIRVRRILRNALRRIDHLSGLKNRLADLAEADGREAAAILHTILAANEPFLLSERKDDLWIGEALKRQPLYFSLFASKRLSELQTNWKADAV